MASKHSLGPAFTGNALRGKVRLQAQHAGDDLPHLRVPDEQAAPARAPGVQAHAGAAAFLRMQGLGTTTELPEFPILIIVFLKVKCGNSRCQKASLRMQGLGTTDELSEYCVFFFTSSGPYTFQDRFTPVIRWTLLISDFQSLVVAGPIVCVAGGVADAPPSARGAPVQAYGPGPDGVTYERLITGLLRAGKVQEACEILRDACARVFLSISGLSHRYAACSSWTGAF